MNFLVDAQSPRRIALWLRSQGHDALHTLDLSDQNRTTDTAIVATRRPRSRVVVTKDADFVQSFVLRHQPAKPLLISTGNISNAELGRTLARDLPAVVAAVAMADL